MASSPSPAKIEDPISPCRPRLTAEQTAFLEESYIRKSKPSTLEKKQHAEELGLTQEKVNNWFQNRRAKSKQSTRNRHELSILTADDPHLHLLLEHGHSALLFPSSPEHYSEFEGMSLAMQNDRASHSNLSRTSTWPLPDTLPYVDGNLIGHSDGLHYLNTPLAVHGPMATNHGDPDGEFSSASSAYQESMPEPMFAPNSAATQREGHYYGEYHGANSSHFDQQLAEQMGDQFPHHCSAPRIGQAPAYSASVGPGQEQSFMPATNLSLRLQAASNSLSQAGALQHSPSPPTPARSFPHSLSNSRRGSNHSDLVNHVNAVRQQQSSPYEEVFKTPDLPDNTLASRRKRQRPANLISMRAVSGPAAGEESPRGKTATLPQTAVRRIKSQGHGLNVLTGRVQKPGVQTPTRSPLTISFLEGVAQEETVGSPFPKELQPSRIQTNMVSFPERNVSLATSPSSLGAPPLSASCTQASFEDPLWLASPPITPYFGPGGDFPVEVAADGGWMASHGCGPALDYLSRCNDYGEVPQSAPAHITSFNFPGASPPTAHPIRTDIGGIPHFAGIGPSYLDMRVESNRNNSVPTVSAQPDTPFYAPQPLAPASQLPSTMASAAAAFDAPPESISLPSQPYSSHPQPQSHSQRIIRPSSSSGNRREAADWPLPNQRFNAMTFGRPERHMNTFFAAPPPTAQKELEIVMARFPSPPKGPRPDVGMKGPIVYTWQHSGPGDFKSNVSPSMSFSRIRHLIAVINVYRDRAELDLQTVSPRSHTIFQEEEYT